MAQDTKNSKNTFINNVIWYVVGILDYLNTSSIYSSYVTPTLMQIFQQSLQFIFYPIYAINTAIYAVLALINLFFDRTENTKQLKTENLIRLCVNIFSAIMVGIAVIGTLAFASAMGIATTFLFAINLGITTLYNFSGAGYHLYQFIKKGPEERKAHLGSMIGYLVVGTTIALSALAGALSVLAGFLPLAGIGIFAGILGAAFCIYALVNEVNKNKTKNIENTENSHTSKSTSTDTLMIIKNLYHGITFKMTEIFRVTKCVTKIDEGDANSTQAEIYHQSLEGQQSLSPVKTAETAQRRLG